MIASEIGVIFLPTAFKVVLRFLWYTFSRLLIWGLAIGFIVLSFFVAMDYMNVQILTKDGMQVRAEVIIKGDDPTPLSKVFSKNFLVQDEMLDSDIYRNYLVSDFDYAASVDLKLIFPWNKTVKLRVKEEISNINAKKYVNAQNDSDNNEEPPAWDNAIYDVTLTRYEQNWRIVEIALVELLPKPTPSPSPSPSVSQAPSPTPIPTAELTEE